MMSLYPGYTEKHKRAWHGNGEGRGAVGERAEAEGVCGGVYIMPAGEDFLRGMSWKKTLTFPAKLTRMVSRL